MIDRCECCWCELVFPVEIELHQKDFLGDNDARRESRLDFPIGLGVEHFRERRRKFQATVEFRIDDRQPVLIGESQWNERCAVLVDLPFDHARHPFV